MIIAGNGAFSVIVTAKMVQEKGIYSAVIHFLSSQSLGTVIKLFLIILVCKSLAQVQQ